MTDAVIMDGERHGRWRSRIPQNLWAAVSDWCDEHRVEFEDHSTMFHAIIALPERDAVEFRLRWEGETQ